MVELQCTRLALSGMSSASTGFHIAVCWRIPLAEKPTRADRLRRISTQFALMARHLF